MKNKGKKMTKVYLLVGVTFEGTILLGIYPTYKLATERRKYCKNEASCLSYNITEIGVGSNGADCEGYLV